MGIFDKIFGRKEKQVEMKESQKEESAPIKTDNPLPAAPVNPASNELEDILNELITMPTPEATQTLPHIPETDIQLAASAQEFLAQIDNLPTQVGTPQRTFVGNPDAISETLPYNSIHDTAKTKKTDDYFGEYALRAAADKRNPILDDPRAYGFGTSFFPIKMDLDAEVKKIKSAEKTDKPTKQEQAAANLARFNAGEFERKSEIKAREESSSSSSEEHQVPTWLQNTEHLEFIPLSDDDNSPVASFTPPASPAQPGVMLLPNPPTPTIFTSNRPPYMQAEFDETPPPQPIRRAKKGSTKNAFVSVDKKEGSVPELPAKESTIKLPKASKLFPHLTNPNARKNGLDRQFEVIKNHHEEKKSRPTSLPAEDAKKEVETRTLSQSDGFQKRAIIKPEERSGLSKLLNPTEEEKKAAAETEAKRAMEEEVQRLREKEGFVAKKKTTRSNTSYFPGGLAPGQISQLARRPEKKPLPKVYNPHGPLSKKPDILTRSPEDTSKPKQTDIGFFPDGMDEDKDSWAKDFKKSPPSKGNQRT